MPLQNYKEQTAHRQIHERRHQRVHEALPHRTPEHFHFFLKPGHFFLRTPFRAFFLCLSDIYFFGTQNISAQGLSRHSPAYIMRRPIFIRREQIRRTPITCAIRKFVPRFFLRRKALRTGSYPLPPPLPPHSAAPLLFCRALLRRSLA